jgi:hypothetical protein
MRHQANNKEEQLSGYDSNFFLGPSEQRYFGSTYKKTEHTITNLIIQNDCLYGDLTMQWPMMWSQKEGHSLAPHVGTLDFFVVATRFVELYMAMVENRSSASIERTWMSSFFCKAGSRFIESNRSPCSCYKISDGEENNVKKSLYEITIDNSTVRIGTIHSARKNKKGYLIPSIISQNGDKNLKMSYYTDGYRIPERKIHDIVIDEETRSITANLELIGYEQPGLYYGLGQSYMPCLTFGDLVLTTGQLAQILLFRLSGTTREKSSSLLLRNIDCTYTAPVYIKTTLTATILQSDTIRVKDTYYNSASLAFNFNNGDLVARCKVTHQIIQHL